MKRTMMGITLCLLAAPKMQAFISVSTKEISQSQDLTFTCNSGNYNINTSGGGDVYVMNGDCYADITQMQYAAMGKAGDIHTIPSTDLPSQEGVNLFKSMNPIAQDLFFNNVQGPKLGDKGVMFSFVSQQGIPNNYLVRVVEFDPSEMERWDNQGSIDLAKNMIQANPNKKILKTEYLHNQPGISQEWTELRFDLNPEGSTESVAGKPFNATITPQGKVQIKPQGAEWTKVSELPQTLNF